MLDTLQKKFRKFAVLTKIDEEQQTVTGLATEEVVDCAGEIFDYESSAPYFKAWSEHASEVTGGESLGNLREMHQLIAAGRLTSMDCQDEAKCITITAKVVDPNSWLKVKERVLIGFSIGGSYVKTWKDKANKATRFTANPSEISLVDLPCVPTALIGSFKAATCQLVKADGSTEILGPPKEVNMPEQAILDGLKQVTADVKRIGTTVQGLVTKGKSEAKTKRVAGEDLASSCFAYVGDPDKTDTWHYPIKCFSTEEKTKRHIRNALSQWEKPNGKKNIPDDEQAAVYRRIKAAARKYGIGSDSDKAAQAEMVKSMYDISDMAALLASARYLMNSCANQAVWEDDQDDAYLAEALHGWLEDGIAILKDIVDEETGELLAAKSAEGANNMDKNELEKKKASLAGIHKKLSEHFGKAAEHHTKKAEHHADMMEVHKNHMETCKAAMDGAEGDMKEVHKSHHAMHKAAHDHHKFGKAHHEKMADHCAKVAEGYEHGAAALESAFSAEGAAVSGGAKAAGAEVQKTAAATDPADLVKSFVDAIAAANKPIVDAITELKTATSAEKLGEVVKSQVDEALKSQVQRPGVTAVPRALGKANGAAPVSDGDCGL